MKILAIPVSGSNVTSIRIDTYKLIINNTVLDLNTISSQGSVRLEDDIVIIEYAELGGLSVSQIGDMHDVRVIPPKIKHENIKEENTVVYDPLPDMRANMRVQRWKIIVALGEIQWHKILDFCISEKCNWAMRQTIDTITEIPRISEFVDLLMYILDLNDLEIDDIFKIALSLRE